MSEWTVNRTSSYEVDVDALRAEFGSEVAGYGIDTEDDFEFVLACWDLGVRDPHFEERIIDDYDFEFRRAANSQERP